ncbi:MAG: hypothetical protein K2Q03_02110 [Sphingobacteriaceae bacterium]|nr:hypothetical protein [Sphingobacteriaceae bacterium]
MLKSKKHLIFVFFVALSACNSDDFKQAATIKVSKEALSVDRSYDVDVVYSDSAVVKAKGKAPILDKITPKTGMPYQEMPKGVFIEFYDANLQVTGSLSSGYALKKENERQTVFRKNVILKGPKGSYQTEELIWDENTRMYSSPSGTFTQIDGTSLSGSNFSADQKFTNIHMNNGNGVGFLKNGIE